MIASVSDIEIALSPIFYLFDHFLDRILRMMIAGIDRAGMHVVFGIFMISSRIFSDHTIRAHIDAELRRTCAWIFPISVRISVVAASPALITNPACFSETWAPPTRTPWKPES